MKWDKISGSWRQLHRKAKERWGKLTSDDLDAIDGEYEHLLGLLRERYGLPREQAVRDVKDWMQMTRE